MGDYKEKRNNLLKRHEGEPKMVGGLLQSYRDSEGLWTGGYGHCWERKGITRRAAEVILEDDLIDAENAVERMALGDIGDARRAAVVSMCFNLGEAGLSKFVDMLAALRKGDWFGAKAAAINSRWYGQVGVRGPEIAEMLLTNEWPE